MATRDPRQLFERTMRRPGALHLAQLNDLAQVIGVMANDAAYGVSIYSRPGIGTQVVVRLPSGGVADV